MQLRNDAKYDLMTLTSMGVRITPENRQPAHVANRFEMQATSAETNVLHVSASLGLHTKALTKFVAGSPIARFIQGELRRRNIAFEGPEVEQGGPWGYRHQFNIADSGFGLRGPRVHNDRAGEVGRSICAQDYDLHRLFKQEGCRILHLSGLIAAMSEETGRACVKLAQVAKENGALVSFDLNYRASFWEGRQAELLEVFKNIAAQADILIGNEEDFQLALSAQGPKTGNSEIGGEIEVFRQMIDGLAKTYPGVKVFANTLREVCSANEHLWGAILRADGEWYIESPRPIVVLDRIGGGDGFVGGLLYGILKQWEPEKWLQFGWATGAFAATVLNDYATPMDEAQVFGIYKGNARVLR